MSELIWKLPPRRSSEDPALIRPGNNVSPTPAPRKLNDQPDAEQAGSGDGDETTPNSQPNFARLFQMTEEFAQAHLNFPDAKRDRSLAPAIDAFIFDAAPDHIASQLMPDPERRYHLLTRSILMWLKEAVLNHGLFAKIVHPAVMRLSILGDTLYQNLPLRTRHEILSQIGREVEQIMLIPSFDDLLHGLVRKQTSDLFDLVYPLMHQPGKSPYSDLTDLLYEAYDVGMVMAFLPVEWEFEYPSPNLLFLPVMVNRDPSVRLHTKDIVEDGYRVRLGFIPRVMFKSYDNDEVSDWIVFRPHVLLRYMENGRGMQTSDVDWTEGPEERAEAAEASKPVEWSEGVEAGGDVEW